MAFQLYKSLTSTQPSERYIPTEAMAAGELVKLVPTRDSGALMGKVTRIAGGQDNSDIPYGVVQDTVTAAEVTAGATVQVIPINPDQIWKADAAATCAATTINTATGLFLAAKGTAGAAGSYAVTLSGTITYKGNLVTVVGIDGALADKKYLVKFNRIHLTGSIAFTT